MRRRGGFEDDTVGAADMAKGEEALNQEIDELKPLFRGLDEPATPSPEDTPMAPTVLDASSPQAGEPSHNGGQATVGVGGGGEENAAENGENEAQGEEDAEREENDEMDVDPPEDLVRVEWNEREEIETQCRL